MESRLRSTAAKTKSRTHKMAKIRDEGVSVSLLRQLISYNPETGELTWLPRWEGLFLEGRHSASHACRKWNTRYSGAPALAAAERHGYGHGDILGKRYKAHRVAWALYYGAWPAGDIDHINGLPADNRIVNLREVTKSENMRNQKRSIANRSGVTGVSWNSLRGKWSAQIKFDGRKRHLGLFARIEDAAEARKAAERRFGFHPNHGRCAA